MATLQERLSEALPLGYECSYYHVSTLPTLTSALFSPPPSRKPQKTYCESHTLLVAQASASDSQAAIYAIEVQIYTTVQLTTIFVAKADSTGLATVSPSPHRSGPSVISSVTSVFISYLVEHRCRSDRNLVVSLFARAQNSYLFPGSDENGKKHILDDRHLVKWWCKTLDPVLRQSRADRDGEIQSMAHILVPGHDKYETVAFFPPSARSDAASAKRWICGYPVRHLAPTPSAPPRCLVPHFPDDPKSRFLIDLDDELNDVPSSQQSITQSPSKRGAGFWKGVRTLDQFWEMMAFRQECSSGRLVGFLWMVFRPSEAIDDAHNGPESPTLRPMKASADRGFREQKQSTEKKQRIGRRRKPLTGIIVPRQPRAKGDSPEVDSQVRPETTRYYHCPLGSRGRLVLREKAYERACEILLRLDFSTTESCSDSTARWIREVGIVAGWHAGDWGIKLRGRRQPAPLPITPGRTANTVRVKRKARNEPTYENGAAGGARRTDAASNDVQVGNPSRQPAIAVNNLGSSIVRRKSK